MRLTILALCVLGMPCLSSAQAANSSWANLSTLHAGQKIEVVQTNSKKVSGTFLDVSDSAITLQEKAGEKTIERPEVRSVRLIKNKHRLRNALIGAGIGAGAGAGIGAASYRQKCGPDSMGVVICGQPFFSKGFDTAFGAAVGLVGGAALGALWPTHEIIYRLTGA
jgi:hypothetical protein